MYGPAAPPLHDRVYTFQYFTTQAILDQSSIFANQSLSRCVGGDEPNLTID